MGDTDAISHLGHMYANGLGVPADNETALEYFRKGAEKVTKPLLSRSLPPENSILPPIFLEFSKFSGIQFADRGSTQTLDTAIEPLLSRSTTGELNPPPDYLRKPTLAGTVENLANAICVHGANTAKRRSLQRKRGNNTAKLYVEKSSPYWPTLVELC